MPGFRNGVSLFPLMLSQLRHVTQRHSDKIYERLRTIFRKCNNQFRREIIGTAEFTLHTHKHDDFAQLLMY